MEKLVSMIMPVYNVGKYLEKNIRSLLEQTYKNIELIYVNDGSLDNSLDVIKKYAKLDSRIVIVDRQNGGVSSARNAGLNIAKGDYIGFCDPR